MPGALEPLVHGVAQRVAEEEHAVGLDEHDGRVVGVGAADVTDVHLLRGEPLRDDGTADLDTAAQGRPVGRPRPHPPDVLADLFHVPSILVERPEIEKPDGDIPFELGIDDIVVGDGDEATAGTTVSVHYVGVAFRSGEEFDASWNRGEPFRFKLGKGQVIPGWDQGVAGMRVGGRRQLTIPSAMAYGARGAGGVIEPHEPLVFVVDLLAVD
jgi:peptidylprolyl isomerase